MAKLILKTLTCHAQEDWTGDDNIHLLVDGSTVWHNSMDTGQTRDLGNEEIEFSGSVQIKLLEKDIEGDDNLGTASVSESNSGSDRVVRFQQDDADYSLTYRVNADEEEDDEWWQDEGENGDGAADQEQDRAEQDGDDTCPTGNGAPGDPAEPCPLGTLTVLVINDEGAPIVGAIVAVEPKDLTIPTNLDGRFGPVQLPQGVYTIEVSKEGYLPAPFVTMAVLVPGAEVEIVATLGYPEIGVSIQAGDVACPGHKHEVKAVGAPAGGTFDWTVESGNVRLVDSAGSPTTSGDTVYVQGLDPQEVELSVKYTKEGREATDAKTIKIHKIRFTVTDFWVKRGESRANELAGGMEITNAAGKATFAMDPKVKIHLNDCPRKSNCAVNHQAGWLQTVRANDRETKYPSTTITDTVPLPIRDAVPPYASPPFYDDGAVMLFFNDQDEETIHHEDSPGTALMPWTDARPAAVGDLDLEHLTMKNTFTAWLVVQNIEWATDVSTNDSLTYLKNISWRCGMKVPADCTKAVGSRAGKRSEKAKYWGAGDGKGPQTPNLAGPVANTSNVTTQVPP